MQCVYMEEVNYIWKSITDFNWSFRASCREAGAWLN